jgi:hypothetical protein
MLSRGKFYRVQGAGNQRTVQLVPAPPMYKKASPTGAQNTIWRQQQNDLQASPPRFCIQVCKLKSLPFQYPACPSLQKPHRLVATSLIIHDYLKTPLINTNGLILG